MARTATARKVAPQPAPLKVPAFAFVDLLTDCALFASADRSRPVLNRVRLVLDPAAPSLAGTATDSYVLIESQLPLPDETKGAAGWERFVSLSQVRLVKALMTGQSRRERPEVTVTVDPDEPGLRLTVGMSEVVVGVVPGVNGSAAFPDVAPLWDMAAKAKKGSRVALNPRFVAKFSRLSGAKDCGVAFELGDDLSPVAWSLRHPYGGKTLTGGATTRGLIMPIRIKS